MANNQRPPPPATSEGWRPAWNEQYQRYFFVDRAARRPTWTNPILNERRSSRSRESVSTGESSTHDDHGPSPGSGSGWRVQELASSENESPEPVSLEQPTLRKITEENQAPTNETFLTQQPGPRAVGVENVLLEPEPGHEFEMSGALRPFSPELTPHSPTSVPGEDTQPHIPTLEERGRTPTRGQEELAEAPTPLSEGKTDLPTPEKEQPQTGVPSSSRRMRDKIFSPFSRSRSHDIVKSVKKHPKSIKNQRVPPQDNHQHLPGLANDQTRPPNLCTAQSYSPPTCRPQRQRQTRSEEHQPGWMPDMSNYEGSDGARYYWLDPTYIAQRDAENRLRQLDIAAATLEWENNYRGSGFKRVDPTPGGFSGGAYGLATVGGFSGLA